MDWRAFLFGRSQSYGALSPLPLENFARLCKGPRTLGRVSVMNDGDARQLMFMGHHADADLSQVRNDRPGDFASFECRRLLGERQIQLAYAGERAN